MTNWLATRDEGNKRLMTFIPRMGRRYANGRNNDLGSGKHTAVSILSPYIRHRLVLESELVSAAITAHGLVDAEKFIQEVIWRGYFKGWLEQRPQIWSSYFHGLEEDLATLDNNRRLKKDVARAIDGQTNLACFNAWAEELVETGYMHNHARMWFASIWIFTLGLPWRVGADFFYRHLIDGDAASNTLGWRWVAGLHTRGKPYMARADNIATFTAGRFTPRPGDFVQVNQGLESSEPDGLPPLIPLRSFMSPQRNQPTALLITDEDCRIEDFNLSDYDIRTVATLAASSLRSPQAVAEIVSDFESAALSDAAIRAGGTHVSLFATNPNALVKWAAEAGATQIATAYVTTGPLRDWLDKIAPALAAQGITLCEWRRAWDSDVWPSATAGFFKVKQQIPFILEKYLPS